MGDSKRRKQLLGESAYRTQGIAKKMIRSVNNSPILRIIILEFLKEALTYEFQPELIPNILPVKVISWINKNSSIIDLAQQKLTCFTPTYEALKKLYQVLIILSTAAPIASSKTDFSRFNPYDYKDVCEALTIVLEGIFIAKQLNLLTDDLCKME